MKNSLLKKRLSALLNRRRQQNTLRQAKHYPHLVDFCSNDYLGVSQSQAVKQLTWEILNSANSKTGATGSRLLTGHYPLLEETEKYLAHFHKATSALIFNSGYDANLSLLGSLSRKRDLILYDELVHASIYDGMKLSKAQQISFRHNSTEDLEHKLIHHKKKEQVIFILIESVYSMDGDRAPLEPIAQLSEKYRAHLIVDEAHSTGIYGMYGEGLCVNAGIEQKVFARVHTFGKAIGGHGAAVLGSSLLIEFLFNYARPLIYTTALPPHSIAHVLATYRLLSEQGRKWISALQTKINIFKGLLSPRIKSRLLPSDSPIQSLVVGGNEQTKQIARAVREEGFDIRPILGPAVPTGTERLRICLHRFNTNEELRNLCALLNTLPTRPFVDFLRSVKPAGL